MQHHRRTGGAPTRVLVVGGGPGGVVTAAALLRHTAPQRPLDVHIVERAPLIGPGLAYATGDPLHLLNNYAGRMSALDDDPDDLVRWCVARGLAVGADSFLPRSVYGRYLAGLLDRVPIPTGSCLTRTRGEVVDLDDDGIGYLATLDTGRRIHADLVVLALGNPPPRRPRGLDVPDDVYVGDPWAPALVDRVHDDGRVLLVGTGLTMVDVAASVAAARPFASLTAVSRHGLLPERHLPVDRGPAAPFAVDSPFLADLLGAVRRATDRGEDWRGVVESVKGVANDLWASLPEQDRERFVRHVCRYWEVARHRMAPPMADVVDDLLAGGRLRLAAPGDVDASSFDLVVNCTGPAPVTTPGWNTLVDRLAVKGMIWPGPLGLGVDVDPTGTVLDAHGLRARQLYVVGAARRGVEWEVAAVPDLRRQATAIAQRVHAPALDGIAG